MNAKERDCKSCPTPSSLLRGNESGFTLIEVMISGVIVLLLALAISSMLVQMSKQQVRNEDRTVQFEKQQSISYTLRFNPIPP